MARRVQRHPVEPQNTITAGGLIALLRQTRVLTNDSEPTPKLVEHLDSLAARFEHERRMFANTAHYNHLNEVVRDARQLGEQFQASLVVVESLQQVPLLSAAKQTDAQSLLSAAVLRDRVAQLAGLRREIAAALREGGPLQARVTPGTQHFTQALPALRDDIIKAVELAHRRPVATTWRDGPLVRFLEALIPQISGETPTRRTIVEWLNLPF